MNWATFRLQIIRINYFGKTSNRTDLCRKTKSNSVIWSKPVRQNETHIITKLVCKKLSIISVLIAVNKLILCHSKNLKNFSHPSRMDHMCTHAIRQICFSLFFPVLCIFAPRGKQPYRCVLSMRGGDRKLWNTFYKNGSSYDNSYGMWSCLYTNRFVISSWS